MILHPAVLALFVSTALIGFMVLYSAAHAVQILRRWDLGSGSEEQLSLERKTYLLSTLLAYVFAFELLSLFLFIFTAEQLHTYFVGAMCAAGSLNVNPFGYPTLVVKLVNFILAGVWLVMNHVDSRAFDYPLIKVKYRFFLFLIPLILLETFLLANFFLRLRPDIITSCCGTLFGAGSVFFPSETVSLLRGPVMGIFYTTMVLTIGSGVYFFLKGKGGYVFSGMSMAALVVSLAAIISVVSIYIYELPTHHCPFCMLKGEYGYIGYFLYLTLLGGAIPGLCVGILMPFRRMKSLSENLPPFQKKLALTSSVLYLVFGALATARILISNLAL